jgi:hypothetical protein
MALNDPRHHTLKIQRLLTELRDHCRQDIDRVSEPKIQAIFETTGEVLDVLIKAYPNDDRQAEPALRH